eukprot:1916559-Pyramimonas_sp.AAC.1
MAAERACWTVCLVTLLLHSVPTATSFMLGVNTSTRETEWQEPPLRTEAQRSACAAYAGEYEVWYQGAQGSTNMIIYCDCTATQPGIFTDSL